MTAQLPALSAPATLLCLSAEAREPDGEVLLDLLIEDVLIGSEPPGSRLLLLSGSHPPPAGGTATPLAPTGWLGRQVLAGMLWAMSRMRADDAPGDPEIATGHDGLHPTPEQLQRFLQGDPDQRPVMVNLLRYRDPALYARYSLTALPGILGGGGRVLLSGDVAPGADGARQWDQVAIAEWPSRAHFQHIATRQRYQEAERRYRTPALEATALWVCTLRRPSRPAGG